jgi:rhamnosyltransferase
MHKIAVLMATYNGHNWLPEQIKSILKQVNVDLTLYISDDGSSDGTCEIITKMAADDPRIVLLSNVKRMGSAGKNFYRLICDVDVSSFDYIAFADQDDIWRLDKLSRHIGLIQNSHAEAVSSNVLAFWPDGSQKLIDKSQPQKSFDFLFESAGPGCTFLMTSWLVGEVRRQLTNDSGARDVIMHDWLTYAICRAHGKSWIIDAVPSMQYRQHQHNVIGANSGLRAILTRLNKINNGWYRHEVALIARVVALIKSDTKLLAFQNIIQSELIFDRFKLISYALQGRRKFIDRLVLVLSILLFIF